jgi:hypothetical protein
MTASLLTLETLDAAEGEFDKELSSKRWPEEQELDAAGDGVRNLDLSVSTCRVIEAAFVAARAHLAAGEREAVADELRAIREVLERSAPKPKWGGDLG